MTTALNTAEHEGAQMKWCNCGTYRIQDCRATCTTSCYVCETHMAEGTGTQLEGPLTGRKVCDKLSCALTVFQSDYAIVNDASDADPGIVNMDDTPYEILKEEIDHIYIQTGATMVEVPVLTPKQTTIYRYEIEMEVQIQAILDLRRHSHEGWDKQWLEQVLSGIKTLDPMEVLEVLQAADVRPSKSIGQIEIDSDMLTGRELYCVNRPRGAEGISMAALLDTERHNSPMNAKQYGTETLTGENGDWLLKALMESNAVNAIVDKERIAKVVMRFSRTVDPRAHMARATCVVLQMCQTGAGVPNINSPMQAEVAKEYPGDDWRALREIIADEVVDHALLSVLYGHSKKAHSANTGTSGIADTLKDERCESEDDFLGTPLREGQETATVAAMMEIKRTLEQRHKGADQGSNQDIALEMRVMEIYIQLRGVASTVSVKEVQEKMDWDEATGNVFGSLTEFIMSTAKFLVIRDAKTLGRTVQVIDAVSEMEARPGIVCGHGLASFSTQNYDNSNVHSPDIQNDKQIRHRQQGGRGSGEPSLVSSARHIVKDEAKVNWPPNRNQV